MKFNWVTDPSPKQENTVETIRSFVAVVESRDSTQVWLRFDGMLAECSIPDAASADLMTHIFGSAADAGRREVRVLVPYSAPGQRFHCAPIAIGHITEKEWVLPDIANTYVAERNPMLANKLTVNFLESVAAHYRA